MFIQRHSVLRRARTFVVLAAVGLLARNASAQADEVSSGSPGVALLTTPRWHILLTTPRSYARLGIDEQVAALLTGCSASLNPTRGYADTLKSARPWAAVDARAADRIELSVAIVPILSNRAECARPQWNDPAVVARGMRVVTGADYMPGNDAASAQLVVDGRMVAPREAVRAPIVLASTLPTRDHVPSQVRLQIDLEQLVFRRTPQRVELEISTVAPDAPERVVIPTEAMDIIWNEILAERIAALEGRTIAAMRAPVTLPAPDDRDLHAAWTSYQSGDMPQAALRSLPPLGQPGLSERDQRAGMVQLSLALFGAGDTTSARIVAARFMRTSPCFTLASSAPEAYRAAFSDAKPQARCDTKSSAGVLGAGIVFPGLGQMVTGHAALGRVAALVAAGLGAEAGLTLRRANAVYADYQASRTAKAATTNYGRASHLRSTARYFAIAGVATWAGSAIQAMVAEWRHARSVSELTEYGSK